MKRILKLPDKTWNFLTVLVLAGILGLVSAFAIIFVNPTTPMNPFPPQQLPDNLAQPTKPSIVLALPPTWTTTPLPPTFTPTITPSFTASPTLEPTLTTTPIPTDTSTVTPTIRVIRRTSTRTPTRTLTVTPSPQNTPEPPTSTPPPTATPETPERLRIHPPTPPTAIPTPAGQ